MKNVFIDLRMIRNSGIGTYIRNVVPGILSSCKNIRFEVLVREADLPECAWLRGGDVTVRIGSAPIYSLSEQMAFVKTIGKQHDLVWIPHYTIPYFRRGRLLVTVHDVFHLAMPHYVQGLHKRLYAKMMFNAVARNADVIICASRFTAEELARLTPVDSRRIRVIPHGIASAPEEARDNTAPRSRPYILFVGNVKPNKNIARLINAFSRVVNRIEHDLVIVGKKEGFITGDATAAEKAARLKGRVDFTGAVTDAVLRRYYRYADVFVFPSLYEGFGFPPLEAMQCGCPVIASRQGSIPEICGDAAYYVDPYDVGAIVRGLLAVLSDQAVRARLRRLGTERVKSFTWESSIAAHAGIISELLD